MIILKIGSTQFTFNRDLSGQVIIDIEPESHEPSTMLVVPYCDVDAFISRARSTRQAHEYKPKDPVRVAERAAKLAEVKEKVTKLIQELQGNKQHDELSKKLYQVAINAVNGAR